MVGDFSDETSGKLLDKDLCDEETFPDLRGKRKGISETNFHCG